MPHNTNIQISKQDLDKGLRALGIRPGMGLMVHSSLSSFGQMEGGAETIVAELMNVLTAQGTLLMPSFNHGQPFGDGGSGIYDPLVTPTTNGAIPDYFWRTPGVYRSLNPTHPFAAWGRHARRYIQDHHNTLTMGPESPLGLLLADDGYTLLMGVNYRANTFHHVVEMTRGVPCLGRRSEAYPVLLPDGEIVSGRTWGWRASSCPFTDQNRYADRMAERGLQRQIQVGASTLTLFRLQDCFDVVSEILQNGRDGFPPCSHCSIRPRRVAQTVESDWNE